MPNNKTELPEPEPLPDYSDSASFTSNSLPSTPPFTISGHQGHNVLSQDGNWSFATRLPPSYVHMHKQWSSSQSGTQIGSLTGVPEIYQQKKFQHVSVDSQSQNQPHPPVPIPGHIEISQGDCPNCGVGTLKRGECTGSMIIFNLFCGIFGVLLAPFGVCMICMKCPPDVECPHCKATFDQNCCG